MKPNNKEYLWTEKYRPLTIEDAILPKDLKKTFLEFVKKGKAQNMLFHGAAGTGKTTIAKALCDDLGFQYLFINSSMESSIDNLRTKISQFVMTGSLRSSGKHKVVIFDEANNLSNASMEGLNSFIETFSKNTFFIFTTNHPNQIIKPLQSRCLDVEFNLRKDSQNMMAQYMTRLQTILTDENIEYDNMVLAKLIKMFFPDFRRTLNELQRYSLGGIINAGIFADIQQVDVEKVFGFLKSDSLAGWGEMRKYFDYKSESIEPSGFVDDMYNALDEFVADESIPAAILLIDDFSTNTVNSVSKKISLIALCSRMMNECVFK